MRHRKVSSNWMEIKKPQMDVARLVRLNGRDHEVAHLCIQPLHSTITPSKLRKISVVIERGDNCASNIRCLSISSSTTHDLGVGQLVRLSNMGSQPLHVFHDNTW